MSLDLQKAYDFFCQVKQDLKTKNRFSVDARFDKLIDLCVAEQSNAITLQKGQFLLRARIYNCDDAEEKFYHPPIGTRFKGYSARDSYVNLNHENVTEGRCNPQYIPYLYASQSEDCCIHEVRPEKGAYVNIARIKVNENLRILGLKANDLYIAKAACTILEDVWDATMFVYLAHEFSRPHKNFGDYLLCQYVSEKVKTCGFDGIAYESAVYTGEHNVNYVIFNYDKCKATSSSLRYISDLRIVTQLPQGSNK